MSRLFVLLLVSWLPAFASAAPDRVGLIEAWEAVMRADGTLEAQADGGYRYRSDSLGYDGSVKVLAAIVRADGHRVAGSEESPVNGSVDFELPDLPAAREGTQSTGLMIWKSQRQNFVYDAEAGWLSIAQWAAMQPDHEEASVPARPWLLTYVVPGGLLVLIAVVLLGAVRQQQRVRGLVAESHEVNRMGRENIERAAALRESQVEAAQESLELARRNAATLEAILGELRRQPLR